MALCKRFEHALSLHLSHAHEKRRDKLEPGVLVPGVPPPAEYSRNYQSVPQPGLNNKPQAVNSAAVVGGGTVINGMFFNRGSAGDYDNWAKLGNPGWGWKDLLPYFKKVGPRLRALYLAFGTNVHTALSPGNARQCRRKEAHPIVYLHLLEH